jgi:methylenetetrahydrofolate dehydrogenase (NADP+)/methenyltetrahydrofolate cyclohydrolase
MPPVLINGKSLAEKIIQECRKEAESLRPTLAVVIVGDHPASKIYVRNKEKTCRRAGIESLTLSLPNSITQEELLKKIESLNADPRINGFIVQLPLPEHIHIPEIIRSIKPEKDVDGFHAYNLGKMFLNAKFEHLPPATPAGIIHMLEEYNIPLQGKEVVVVGHSNTVGKPISTMLLNRDATVTTCHIHTKDLKSHTLRADILIVAVGKANLITDDMVKEGVVVIDVGISRLKNKKLIGDVDFDNVSKKASYISPVPGGVGPMTIASLMRNTINATRRQKTEKK